MIDADQLKRLRREEMRWHLLTTLDLGRPVATNESICLSVLRSVYPDTTQRECRIELDYLSDRQLVEINKRPDGAWWCELTRYGVDVVEYTVAVEAGIARPHKG